MVMIPVVIPIVRSTIVISIARMVLVLAISVIPVTISRIAAVVVIAVPAILMIPVIAIADIPAVPVIAVMVIALAVVVPIFVVNALAITRIAPRPVFALALRRKAVVLDVAVAALRQPLAVARLFGCVPTVIAVVGTVIRARTGITVFRAACGCNHGAQSCG
jgi:hypothetical protein